MVRYVLRLLPYRYLESISKHDCYHTGDRHHTGQYDLDQQSSVQGCVASTSHYLGSDPDHGRFDIPLQNNSIMSNQVDTIRIEPSIRSVEGNNCVLYYYDSTQWKIMSYTEHVSVYMLECICIC